MVLNWNFGGQYKNKYVFKKKENGSKDLIPCFRLLFNYFCRCYELDDGDTYIVLSSC